ncbi:hypothetical protein ARMGADRAFT_1040810 [Armillaria gallica]|uniref:Uncharacterized protein n=1 Tax=Armillaria gallica TaxID=47427 RepID=A0A2H3C8M6_ARMGA|nr:hypothetical protein ARMGADRAFT_1040810 [Armillaria gallica]
MVNKGESKLWEDGAGAASTRETRCPKIRKHPDADSFSYQHPTQSLAMLITALRGTQEAPRPRSISPALLTTREIDLTATFSQIQKIEMMDIQCSNQLDTLSRGSDGTPGYATLPEMTIMLATCQPNYTDRTLRQITGVLPHLSDQSHVDVRAPFYTVPTIPNDITGSVVIRVSTTRTHFLGYSTPALSGTTIEVLALLPQVI